MNSHASEAEVEMEGTRYNDEQISQCSRVKNNYADEKRSPNMEDFPPSSVEAATLPTMPTQQKGPTGLRFYMTICGLMLSLFLFNFDRVVVATAIPVIASRFDALDQAPWIATSFMVTQAGFMLAFGQLMTVASNKWVYFSTILIILLGSVLCGVAWSFPALLAGRAIVGLGAGGMMVAVLVIASSVSTLEQRPMLFAIMGLVAAVANIVGPVIGGALTDLVSWRWCFYINIPITTLNMAIAVIFFDDSESYFNAEHDKGSPLWERLVKLDWIGNFLCFAAMFSLLYSLQSGGIMVPWSDKTIIVTFCVFGLLTGLFLLWEYRVGNSKAALPLILFTRRTTVAIAIEGTLVFLLNAMGHFFLPIYYQAAREHSAVHSAIDILPYMLALIVGSVATGAIIKRTGRPWPFLLSGPLITATASGLIFWVLTMSPGGLTTWLIFLQLIFGVGLGCTIQQIMIYVQAEYREERKWIPQASAMVNFTNGFGGLIGVSVSGVILAQRLRIGLPKYAPDLPASDAVAVLKSVSAIRGLDDIWKEQVKKAYAEALGYVFLLGVPSGILSSVAAAFMKRYNLKK